VFTGPLYLSNQEDDGKYYTRYEVLHANTAVPTHFFKVILGEKDGSISLGAFILPNSHVEQPLTDFEVPVDVVELASGLEFFKGVDRKKTRHLCKTVKCVLSEFRQALIKDGNNKVAAKSVSENKD
jgi:endonuclease G, mitochondrial